MLCIGCSYGMRPSTYLQHRDRQRSERPPLLARLEPRARQADVVLQPGQGLVSATAHLMLYLGAGGWGVGQRA